MQDILATQRQRMVRMQSHGRWRSDELATADRPCGERSVGASPGGGSESDCSDDDASEAGRGIVYSPAQMLRDADRGAPCAQRRTPQLPPLRRRHSTGAKIAAREPPSEAQSARSAAPQRPPLRRVRCARFAAALRCPADVRRRWRRRGVQPRAMALRLLARRRRAFRLLEALSGVTRAQTLIASECTRRLFCKGE